MTFTARIAASVTALCAASAAYTATAHSQAGPSASGEWRDYGGDKGYTKYSPIDQITADNVSRLHIAWRRPAVADELTSQNPSLTVSQQPAVDAADGRWRALRLEWHRPGRGLRSGDRQDDLGPGVRRRASRRRGHVAASPSGAAVTTPGCSSVRGQYLFGDQSQDRQADSHRSEATAGSNCCREWDRSPPIRVDQLAAGL